MAEKGIALRVWMLAAFSAMGLIAASCSREPVVSTGSFSDDGAWCWFQDPRAVYVKGSSERTYAQWMTQGGSLVVGAYDHPTGAIETFVLKEVWDSDDHNVGAFLVLPDKRLMVFYARHNKEGLLCRTTVRPEDISQWEAEATVSPTTRITYAHPVYLSEEKRFYVFWRGPTWKPTFATSSDGKTWSEPKVLIQEENRDSRSIRPYTKITSDGKASIHLTFTDGHPRDEVQNSVYYLRYSQGNFFKADGSLAGDLDALPIRHGESDLVYDGKAANVRAWVWDIALDQRGYPVIAYTRLPEERDHRYCYARWNGSRWLDVEVTPGGGWFPQTLAGATEREPHYSGGMSLNPDDPSVLYLARPVKGVFEIERWSTPDEGSTWSSEPVTANSSAMNVRPVVPRGYRGQKEVVLWMQGSYQHYTNYATGIRYWISE